MCVYFDSSPEKARGWRPQCGCAGCLYDRAGSISCRQCFDTVFAEEGGLCEGVGAFHASLL